MHLTCPYCGFSKTVAAEQIPPNVTKVTCPKCQQDFPFKAQVPLPSTTEETQEHQTPAVAAQELPKAGFWLRLVATMIDMIIVLVLQLVLGAALGFSGVTILGANNAAASHLYLLVELFTYVVSFAYYIVFTGYCGQTPGKMALRLKVIRCNGEAIGYGRAAFREIPAKFIAAIPLCIGYLMIVFDRQKQGLHDHMAKTYVIKL